jgi:hypothetical protein
MSTPIPLERSTGIPTEGTHLFKITDAKEKLSKSDNDMWVLTLECQDAGDDQGKQMTVFLSMVPKARFKVDQFLDAIEAPKKGQWEVEQCIGKSLRVTVVHVEYEGSIRANPYTMFPKSSTENPEIPKHGEKSAKLPADASDSSQPRRLF